MKEREPHVVRDRAAAPSRAAARAAAGAAAIRPLQLRDRAPLHQLLTKDGLFTREEIAVALELLDGALAEPGGEYRVLVAELDGAPRRLHLLRPDADDRRHLGPLLDRHAPRGAQGRRRARARRAHGGGAARRRCAPDPRRDLAPRRLRRRARRSTSGSRYPVCAVLPDFYRPGDDLLVMLQAPLTGHTDRVSRLAVCRHARPGRARRRRLQAQPRLRRRRRRVSRGARRLQGQRRRRARPSSTSAR